MGKLDDALATMVANLKDKTGKTLDQWVALASKSKLAKHGEIVKWLKSEHELGHGYANLIAAKTLEAAAGGAAGGDDLLAAQYSGAKAALKPWCDALIAKLRAFGADVELAPKKSYVSVRRSKQFALIQPSTADRLDVGIQLKGVAPTARLEASGSFNSMVSHRVRITAANQIDAELLGWLRDAYERA